MLAPPRLAATDMLRRMHLPRMAAMLHRLSGLALAIFLPLHFLALGLAFDETAFSAFIAGSDNPLVKASEWALVTALAVHLFGGLRLLAIEFFSLDPVRALWIGLALSLGFGVGLAFLIGALA